MDKIEIKDRINKLHPKMQEYIKLGIDLDFFNINNIERVVERLEKTKFEIDNSIPGDAQTIPFRDGSGKTIIKQNKRRMFAKDKKQYFADEVLFHEFTHITNGLYESWFQSLDSWNMKQKIQTFMNDKEKEHFEEYSNDPAYRQAGYGWGLLDDFVAQYVAQSMVVKKYNNKDIYPIIEGKYKACDPLYSYTSELADYSIYSPFTKKFVEALYGRTDLKRFCTESFDKNIVDNIINKYASRKDGLENLYKMLGYLGNIDFAENARVKHFDAGVLNQDKDKSARDPKKLFQSMIELNNLLQNEIEKINR